MARRTAAASCLRNRNHANKTASTTRPGPNPRATHGRGALVFCNRSRMKSTVGDDMLPYSAKTA